MNLVRQIMLPESEHGHLAEVALGGLFTPWEGQGAADPDSMPFDFRPGVREALLGGAAAGCHHVGAGGGAAGDGGGGQ